MEGRMSGVSICRSNRLHYAPCTRSVVAILVVVVSSACLARASFWKFYFPNIMKPTGYKELSDRIDIIEQHINTVKDTYADVKYFWKLMQKADEVKPSLYPEESVCSELFPMFRDLAIEYSAIDYELYLKPFEEYREHLLKSRKEWFPAGEESKAILPREWEQRLLETEVSLKIESHTKLVENQEYRDRRAKLLEIWKSAKRGLDSSMDCIYLRYSYRQVAEDINQLALDTNLNGLYIALQMIRSAYKRIEMFKKSDQKAIDLIAAEHEKSARFEIKQ